MNKSNVRNIFDKYIYFPLIAVVITIIAQQYFFPVNERNIQKLELKKEILKEEFRIIEKMERMVELSEPIVVIVFTHIFMNENNEVYGEDKKGIDVTIPSLVYDKKMQHEWFVLKDEIKGQERAISLDIYRAFNTVCEFVKEHPFPTLPGDLISIEKSLWSESNIIGRWKAINNYLKLKLENKKNLIE